jgi:hypothetical protein
MAMKGAMTGVAISILNKVLEQDFDLKRLMMDKLMGHKIHGLR